MSAARLAARHRAERRFRFLGALALWTGAVMLAVLLGTITERAWPAFQQHYLIVELEGLGDAPSLEATQRALRKELAALAPAGTKRRERRALRRAISLGAPSLAQAQLARGKTSVRVPFAAEADLWLKGVQEPNEDEQIFALTTIQEWQAQGLVQKRIASALFLSGDSREPELAGLKGALLGSALTMFLVLVLSFPLGVGAAVYLQELAPKNRFTDLIEINMNNLAAVPSIVFGLLGLAMFIGFFGLPRSAPLVGGLVLTLMTLPTIIIATRASLAAVPDSLRHGALALGATQMQMIWHNVLPVAMPGILTGTIIGLAQAAGETAPLLMIGMLAFIVEMPSGFTDAATVLPAQIYMWADSPERAFQARTSAAILVLLGFLFAFNALALFLRWRFEKKL